MFSLIRGPATSRAMRSASSAVPELEHQDQMPLIDLGDGSPGHAGGDG